MRQCKDWGKKFKNERTKVVTNCESISSRQLNNAKMKQILLKVTNKNKGATFLFKVNDICENKDIGAILEFSMLLLKLHSLF